MISIEKEKQIRSLLMKGVPVGVIATQAEVTRGTVWRLKKLPKLRKRRRLPEILPKLEKPQRCPTCRGMVTFLPCLLCHPEAGDYDEKEPRN